MKKSWTKYFFFFLKILVLALFFGPFVPYVFASGNDEITEIYQAPQALGRANTFMLDAPMDSALFYNPALLSKTAKGKIDGSYFSIDGIAYVKSLLGLANLKSFNLHKTMEKLKETQGHYYYGRMDALSGFATKGWGIALLGSYRIFGDVIGTNFESNSGTDIVFTAGKGATVGKKGILSVGMSLKAILRNELYGNYNTDELTDDAALKSHMFEGIGLGADIGIAIKPKGKQLPSVAFTWRDLFGTRFFTRTTILNGTSGEGLPRTIPQSLNLGASIKPNLIKAFTTTIAFELQHLERTDFGLLDRTHFGIDIGFKKLFSVQVGLHELFPCFGGNAKTPFGDFSAGFYGEQISIDRRSYNKRVYFKYALPIN